MKNSRSTIFFLTEDINNEKEKNEIEYLTSLGKVVLVSFSLLANPGPGVRCLVLSRSSLRMQKIVLYWSKICYLLARLANSKTDFLFPERNVYSGNEVLRRLVNIFWKVKTANWLNAVLPRYDTLYFFPYRLFMALKGTRNRMHNNRIIVHDSLIVRLPEFAPLIAKARTQRVPTIANVKSWDNPFYSQFTTNASGYLVWGESMWRDIEKTQKTSSRAVHFWGARPFFNFFNEAKRFENQQKDKLPKEKNDSLVIGYAAAFGDGIMAAHEIELIKRISSELRGSHINAVVLIRPYPITPEGLYDSLKHLPNIEIVDIKGEPVDRYGDGRELIRFGSNAERLEYLSQCTCFLSMATSFTIEAAIAKVPIVHFCLPDNLCQNTGEREFFKRLQLSDHLTEYFNKTLWTAQSYSDLCAKLRSTSTDPSEARRRGENLLTRLGVPKNNFEQSITDPDAFQALTRSVSLSLPETQLERVTPLINLPRSRL